jgi:hypothetical protein
MICFTTSVGALRLQMISIYPLALSKSGNSLNQTFVDSHFESIPGLGTFTTGCLSGGNLKSLGGETDGAFDAEFLALGTLDELLADLLEGLDFAGGQGDANLMGFLRKLSLAGCFLRKRGKNYGAFAELLLWLLVGHFGGWFPSRLER